jgi:HPt (histidine-containing phosphotransfer) domain-containing protein
MWTSPGTQELIEGIIVALNNDVLPDLRSDKAQTAVVMIQVLLQCIAQKTPLEQQAMAAEHNAMTAALRDIGDLAGGAAGAASERLRQRAKTLGGRPDMPAMPAYAEIWAAHLELSTALTATLEDIDELLRAGPNPAAEAALTRLRAHLGPRTAQEFATYVVGAGMVGRG